MAIEIAVNRSVDERIYKEELAPWLPERIIDCHVHVRLACHKDTVSPERRKAHWATEVSVPQSWEQLRNNMEVLYPEQDVSVLAFGGVSRETHIKENNEYVLEGALDPANKAQALCATKPEWPASVLEEALCKGFLGIKPYPDLAPQHTLEVGIYDFVPHSHLKVLDRYRSVLMLHLPKVGRLGDPDNIRELLEISDRYPSIKLIVAHVGRAYCMPIAERGLPHFADRNGIYFDTSANLNPDVFELAIETVGPDRLLFGSDMPAMMMRGVREHVGEQYLNYTDGDYSWNKNRKSPEVEANYTYFVYEELRALIAAAKRVGLSRTDIEKIMYINSKKLLSAGIPVIR